MNHYLVSADNVSSAALATNTSDSQIKSSSFLKSMYVAKKKKKRDIYIIQLMALIPDEKFYDQSSRDCLKGKEIPLLESQFRQQEDAHPQISQQAKKV